MMKEDPENRRRWRHKWELHNRGNVWDKTTTCWAGKEDWMTARKKQNSPEEKYKFITYILIKMKLLTENRQTKNKDKEKRLKKKTPRDLGPQVIIVHMRDEGLTVQLCGDSNVACKWTAKLPKEQSTKRQLARFKDSYTHGGRRELPSRSRKITAS